MTKKILVAIDETGLPGVTVRAISAQTHPKEAEVLVLQVVEPIIRSVPPEMARGYQPEMSARQDERAERAKGNLDAAVQALSKAGFKVASRWLESEIQDGILGVAAEWGADLIVMTSHPRKGISKFFHRSIAEGVVHRAPCSVLVVKEMTRKAAA